MQEVEAWMHDISLPTPDAADIAAYLAREEGVSRFAGAGARAALLRLATMLTQMDSYLKQARASNRSLWASVQDTSRTCVVAIERLQQQEGLVRAAVAASRAARANDKSEIRAQSLLIRKEADKLMAIEDKRS